MSFPHRSSSTRTLRGAFDAHKFHHHNCRSTGACRNLAGYVPPSIRNWDLQHWWTHRHDPGTTLQKGASALYVIFEHISFDELSNAVLEAAAARGEHAHSLATLESPALGYSYGLTDWVMVSVELPYVVRTGIREASHDHHDEAAGGETEEHEHEEAPQTVDRGDTEGIGDLTLFGQYRFYGQGAGLQASLLTGIKTPTGETGERDDQGELFEAEFQPGSGSWDPMLGLALSFVDQIRNNPMNSRRANFTNSTGAPRAGRSEPSLSCRPTGPRRAAPDRYGCEP